MNKEVFERYAAIKNKIKDLAEEAKGIEKEVMDEMNEQEADSIQSPIGTFSVVRRLRWKYSPSVDQKELELKAQKKREEEEGTATSTESTGLMFRAKKEDEK